MLFLLKTITMAEFWIGLAVGAALIYFKPWTLLKKK